MKDLTTQINELDHSKSIFTVRKANFDDSSLLFEKYEEYKPEILLDDPLTTLINDHYTERWDSENNKFFVDTHNITTDVIISIKELINQFLLRNIPIKNPKLSKLYKFFRYERIDLDEDIYVGLYRYMRTFVTLDGVSCNEKHTANLLSLLTAMMEKYER